MSARKIGATLVLTGALMVGAVPAFAADDQTPTPVATQPTAISRSAATPAPVATQPAKVSRPAVTPGPVATQPPKVSRPAVTPAPVATQPAPVGVPQRSGYTPEAPTGPAVERVIPESCDGVLREVDGVVECERSGLALSGDGVSPVALVGGVCVTVMGAALVVTMTVRERKADVR